MTSLSRIAPLSSLGEGQKAVVAMLRSGRDMAMRLADLGIRIGSEIEVIHRVSGGPMVIAVGDGRTALGAGMAEKIFVSALRTVK